MQKLISVHRWLGIPLCLFFVMWFGTGMVMHFVPFPALTEAERFAGLTALRPEQTGHGPADAVAKSGLREVIRVRLINRPDGAVYVAHGATGLAAVNARDLSSARVTSAEQALQIAQAHASERSIDSDHAQVVELAAHDQWTVPNRFDPYRPLYRIALNNADSAQRTGSGGQTAGTEVYVSSVTGEVVGDTTAHERRWNYVGSVLHWIYPTLLRRDWKLWDSIVWWLSLAALISALTGAVLGLWRLRWRGMKDARHRLSPYQGWQRWHHLLGLGYTAFVLTWIFSGWLSMDHGRLFPDGRLAPDEAARLIGSADWPSSPAAIDRRHAVREIEWFTFGNQLWQRERWELSAQHLRGDSAAGSWLPPSIVDTALHRLRHDCAPAFAVPGNDSYPVASTVPGAPAYRAVCGDTWLQLDGANGQLLETLDPARRTYRWLYQGLHTLDFPALAARPALRTWLIVLLSTAGLACSVTAVVIGWQRLRKGARFRTLPRLPTPPAKHRDAPI